MPYSKDFVTLTKEETLILSVKYRSKSIKKLTGDELVVGVHQLLLKIHVITGWVIPPNEMMDILIDQLIKKCVESYGSVNMDEIEYAFRNNPVKDWGKNMNLGLIDEVMQPYLAKRREVSIVEEQKKLPEPKINEMSDEEFVEMQFRTWKVRPVLVSSLTYDSLERMGKINLSKEEKKEIYALAEHSLKEKMKTDIWREELERLHANGWKERVRNESKRMAVDNYFSNIKTDI